MIGVITQGDHLRVKVTTPAADIVGISFSTVDKAVTFYLDKTARSELRSAVSELAAAVAILRKEIT